MKRSILTVFAMAAITAASSAQTLRVDFNSNQDNGGDSTTAGPPQDSVANHNQPGWSSYHANHEVSAEFSMATYGSITVTPDWPNTANNNVEQMIDRGAQSTVSPFNASGSNDINWNNANSDLNLVTDFLGTDTRTGSGGNGDWDGVTGTPTWMTLTLGGLSAGRYDWTSYHHDTENVHGFFRVELSLDGGSNYAILADGYMSDSTPLGTPGSEDAGYFGPQVGPDANSLISTYQTSFVADGANDVVFRFAPYSNTNTHRRIWGINGFVLEQTAVPEPSTIALGLIGVGCLAWQARRRRRAA
ncbi:MAG: PEP-CTERM sorting domain-containing protein [Pirellulales bacterium]